jgi:NADPH-dependent ferric siderophore reductase
VDYGGMEFNPGTASKLLLVADETAVPALCGILRDLTPGTRGIAFAEVLAIKDIPAVAGPDGVQVVWLPRHGAAHGSRLIDAVRRHLGLPPCCEHVDDLSVDPGLWETPTYSSTGEPLDTSAGDSRPEPDHAGLYAWIAGEAKMVTTLRRVLVNELELPRSRVAFMGYWRRGVAMRS